MPYAEHTKVPVERTRAEIERALEKAGASQFISGWDSKEGVGRVRCELEGVYLQFEIRAPDPKEFERDSAGRLRAEEALRSALDKELKRRWRVLLLLIKAKLEAITLGQSSVRSEFLANVLLPDQSTVDEWLASQIEEAYAKGTMPKLLK